MDTPLNKAIEIIVKFVDPEKIILFGSRATGESKPDSDYDLFVLKKEAEHRRKLAQQIYRSLYGIGVPVDIIVETPERFEVLKDNPFLIYKEIEKRGKVLYEKPRAKSNLERAKAGKISEEVVYEDLYFDCQQAVEKSLKALLVCHDVVYPRTHSISLLLELVADAGINIPDEIKDAVILSEYAVSTRYPGDYEPMDENEYNEAVQIAEKVISWVKQVSENGIS